MHVKEKTSKLTFIDVVIVKFNSSLLDSNSNQRLFHRTSVIVFVDIQVFLLLLLLLAGHKLNEARIHVFIGTKSTVLL